MYASILSVYALNSFSFSFTKSLSTQNLSRSFINDTCLFVELQLGHQPHLQEQRQFLPQSSHLIVQIFYLNYNELYSAINSLTTGAIDGSDKSTQASCRCLKVLAIWTFLEVFVVCIAGALCCCVFQPNPQSQVSLTRFLASAPPNHNSSTVHKVAKEGNSKPKVPPTHSAQIAAGELAAIIGRVSAIQGANLETR